MAEPSGERLIGAAETLLGSESQVPTEEAVRSGAGWRGAVRSFGAGARRRESAPRPPPSGVIVRPVGRAGGASAASENGTPPLATGTPSLGGCAGPVGGWRRSGGAARVVVCYLRLAA